MSLPRAFTKCSSQAPKLSFNSLQLSTVLISSRTPSVHTIDLNSNADVIPKSRSRKVELKSKVVSKMLWLEQKLQRNNGTTNCSTPTTNNWIDRQHARRYRQQQGFEYKRVPLTWTTYAVQICVILLIVRSCLNYWRCSLRLGWLARCWPDSVKGLSLKRRSRHFSPLQMRQVEIVHELSGLVRLDVAPYCTCSTWIETTTESAGTPTTRLMTPKYPPRDHQKNRMCTQKPSRMKEKGLKHRLYVLTC